MKEFTYSSGEQSVTFKLIESACYILKMNVTLNGNCSQVKKKKDRDHQKFKNNK